MKQRPNMPSLGICAAWAITVAAILAVAVAVTRPEDRSSLFWLRVFWSGFLSSLVWYSVGLFLAQRNRRKEENARTSGVLPSLAVCIATYAGVSFFAMFLHIVMPESDSGNRIHLVGQILVAAATGVTCALLSIARTAASQGVDRIPTGVPTTRELCARLSVQEQRLRALGTDARGCADALRALREAVQYSLPSVGAISGCERYRRFAEQVGELCVSVSPLKTDDPIAVSRCLEAIESLSHEVCLISAELKE